jgi:hypothetical protein
MRLRFSGWVLAVSALALAGSARAQQATTSSPVEGRGIKLGEQMVLHLGLAADIRYDSNVFYETTNTTQAAVLRLSPALELATRPSARGGGAPHKVDFRFYAGMDYSEYLTPDPAVSRHRTFSVLGGAELVILPGFKFTTTIFDNFTRTSQPPYSRLDYNIDRDINELGIRFSWKPGGGRLQLDLSYVFGLDYFEVRGLQDLNRFYHRIDLRAMWKFFPKTAVFIEAQEMPITYWGGGPGVLNHPNSFPFRITAGLVGLITTKLTLRLWIGYGGGFYVTGPSPHTAVAGVDLAWRPTVFSSGVIGYKHDFADSVLGSYYDLDTAYIGWTQIIWRFIASVRLQYSNLRYSGIQPGSSLASPDRTDNFLNFGVNVFIKFKDWVRLGVGYDLTYNQTDAMLNNGAAGLVPLNYTKHEVWLRLAFYY